MFKKLAILLVLASFVLSGCYDANENLRGEKPVIKEIHNMNSEDLFSMQRISEMNVSPNGKWVIYALATPSIEDNKLYRDLWATSVDGKFTLQLTNDEFGEYGPIWSPDSKKIAYISTADGTPQAYVKDFPNGKAKKITEMENGVSNILWSPNGKYLSFSSEVKLDKSPQDNYPCLPKANVRIYDKLPVRHWDEWTDQSYSHIFIVPVKGGKAIDLMPDEKYDSPLKPFGGPEEIAWSKDSRYLVYTCKKVDDYVTSTNSDLYMVDLKNLCCKVEEQMECDDCDSKCSSDKKDDCCETEKPKKEACCEEAEAEKSCCENGCDKVINLTDGMPGYEKVPQFSPDGKWISFISLARPGFESDKARIMLYNRWTKEISELTVNLDQWSEEYVWSPDSKKIYTVSTDSGVYSIFSFDIETKLWKRETKDKWNYGSGLGITKDGKTLVFGKMNMNNPLEIYKMDLASGKETKLTRVNEEKLRYIRPVQTEERWFTANDGNKIHSWIVYPPDFDSTKKYPVIILLQGGPQSMLSQNYHYRWNAALFASQGYIFVAANRRGVPGFGQAWNDAISKDWGGKAMDDYLAVTDQFSQMPYVKQDGKVAIGASAGGYAAFWLAGHHQKRFSAFLAHCGVFDVVSKYGSTEELFFPNWEFGGPYWIPENRANMEKNSPHNYVQNWDTPIIISTGERDFRVPYTQSLEAFTAAQQMGVPSKLIVYPDETHFIAHAQEYILWFNEVTQFLDKYSKK